MKRKISGKLFFTVVGRGLWQAVCWVAGMFGIKDGSKYGKVMKRIFMGALALIALTFAVALAVSFVEHLYWRYAPADERNYAYDLFDRKLSKNYTYFYHEYINKPGYVKDVRTDKKVLDGVVWLYQAEDGDSLAAFKTTKDKRGYFNIYTGKVQIEPQYDKAWIFSEGLASVQKNGEIHFIDHNGHKVFDKTFAIPSHNRGYCFHGGYCAVDSDYGKAGIIDMAGEWVVEPEYDYIESVGGKYWITHKGDLAGVLSDSLTCILPTEYCYVRYDKDKDGFSAIKDGVMKMYGPDGNVLIDFLVMGTDVLTYETEELDEDGNAVRRHADCLTYSIDWCHWGLMDKQGRPLTKAIYKDIIALGKDLFACNISNYESVILDAKGNEVN